MDMVSLSHLREDIYMLETEHLYTSFVSSISTFTVHETDQFLMDIVCRQRMIRSRLFSSIIRLLEMPGLAFSGLAWTYLNTVKLSGIKVEEEIIGLLINRLFSSDSNTWKCAKLLCTLCNDLEFKDQMVELCVPILDKIVASIGLHNYTYSVYGLEILCIVKKKNYKTSRYSVSRTYQEKHNLLKKTFSELNNVQNLFLLKSLQINGNKQDSVMMNLLQVIGQTFIVWTGSKQLEFFSTNIQFKNNKQKEYDLIFDEKNSITLRLENEDRMADFEKLLNQKSRESLNLESQIYPNSAILIWKFLDDDEKFLEDLREPSIITARAKKFHSFDNLILTNDQEHDIEEIKIKNESQDFDFGVNSLKENNEMEESTNDHHNNPLSIVVKNKENTTEITRNENEQIAESSILDTYNKRDYIQNFSDSWLKGGISKISKMEHSNDIEEKVTKGSIGDSQYQPSLLRLLNDNASIESLSSDVAETKKKYFKKKVESAISTIQVPETLSSVISSHFELSSCDGYLSIHSSEVEQVIVVPKKKPRNKRKKKNIEKIAESERQRQNLPIPSSTKGIQKELASTQQTSQKKNIRSREVKKPRKKRRVLPRVVSSESPNEAIEKRCENTNTNAIKFTKKSSRVVWNRAEKSSIEKILIKQNLFAQEMNQEMNQKFQEMQCYYERKSSELKEYVEELMRTEGKKN